MERNTIQMIERVRELNDLVKSARFSDNMYINALNEATEEVVNDMIEPLKNKKDYSFQSSQRVRDQLYPLIPAPATGALVSGHVPYPADYKYYALLWVTIAGIRTFCKPLNYNTEGEATTEDPFLMPADDQVYYNEFQTGLRVLNGPTAPSAYELWYIKEPKLLSIGNDNNKIVTGGVLTALSFFYVYDTAVYSGTTYYPGDLITGTGATLTSGTVILSTNVVNPELSQLDDQVCKLAAEIMSGTREAWNKKQSLAQDVSKI